MYKRIITFTGRIIETQLCALGPRSAGTPKGYVHTHTHDSMYSLHNTTIVVYYKNI